ncbi:hypothetical protein, partial [Sphingomonas sp. CCH10-B3]|uniref:hypothetical protein n=1 Tax=Sphingomonas sp. CCH10-B3 TaxID=1768757 RepID=UPI001E4E02E4
RVRGVGREAAWVIALPLRAKRWRVEIERRPSCPAEHLAVAKIARKAAKKAAKFDRARNRRR